VKYLFWVIVIQGHAFGDHWQADKDERLYYVPDTVSKVSEQIARENAEICRLRQPHWRFDALPEEPPQIYF